MPTLNTNESNASGVHWTAVLAGAFASAGITVILLPLGAGLGMSANAPWHAGTDTGEALTAAAVIWLIVAQWISSGLGGYLTGRLRSNWVGAHTHEVFFRDTAHGFLSWTVVSVVGAIILAIGAVEHADTVTAVASNTREHTTAATRAAATAANNPTATAVASLFTCLSLLIGAFIACVAGALGGRHRDTHYATGSLKELV